MRAEDTVDDSDGRVVLAAYLPSEEPAEPPVTEAVARARAIRRRRRAMLAGAAAVVAVLVGTGVALGPGQAAAPPAGPAPAAPGPTVRPDHASRIAAAPTSPASASSCEQQNRSNDPGARAWARWVRGRVAGLHPQAGPVEWLRMCELDMGYTVFPPHTQHHAEFVLPLGAGTRGTDNLTAAADRFTRLPDQYRTPCKDDLITEHVVCQQRRLPDGSLLVRRDFYDILIYGDPNDPKARRDKQAIRDATRIFPDGRTVTVGLGYNFMPAWKKSFDRHVLSLDQLAAIVTDPGALRYFPRP
jgi:hypothetical protein